MLKGIIIGFVIGYFLTCILQTSIDVNAVKTGVVKLSGKYYRIKPLDEDGNKHDS